MTIFLNLIYMKHLSDDFISIWRDYKQFQLFSEQHSSSQKKTLNKTQTSTCYLIKETTASLQEKRRAH